MQNGLVLAYVVRVLHDDWLIRLGENIPDRALKHLAAMISKAIFELCLHSTPQILNRVPCLYKNLSDRKLITTGQYWFGCFLVF